MNLLILDSGHNELVAGKQSPCKTFREWKFNNEMQHLLKKRAEDHDIYVYLTNPSPAKKDEIGLSKRCELANHFYNSKNKPKSLFVSLHANAYQSVFNSARGTETFIASNASTNSKNAAAYIQSEIVKAMKLIDSGAKDRGVKTNNFTVIYKTAMPSILLEYGFYTNKEDLKILVNNKDELVEATLKGICKYFGISYKPVEKKPLEVPVSNIMYRVCVGSYSNKSNADTILKEAKEKGFKDAFIVAK